MRINSAQHQPARRMPNSNRIKTYKWDVAISLCKQDIDFTKKLVNAINPTLKVFFYEDRQEELISKSGPIEFSKIFKEESRVVVILSRDEWSSSFYTEIERNAIIDRTAVRNEGYQFLMVVPMEQGQIPPWYPTTQIYANPFRFPIEEIAHFIEFKVTEKGGIVKPLTVEDVYQNFIDRIESKNTIIKLQYDNRAIESARSETTILKATFNEKIKFLSKKIVDKVSYYEFILSGNHSYFSYGAYRLDCQLALENEYQYFLTTTQEFVIEFKLFKTFDSNDVFEPDSDKQLIESEQRVFYYTPELNGWALPVIYEQVTNREQQLLFRNRPNTLFYDLIKPVPTHLLVDLWFQRLIFKATETTERFL